MNNYLAISIIMILQANCVAAQSSTTASTGVYIGYEPIKSFPPEKWGGRWYHENIAYLRSDSMRMSTYPVIIGPGKQKAYSSSDGGFYEYRGRLLKDEGTLVAKLLQVDCDYCGRRIIVVDTLAYKAELSYEEKLKRGIIKLDSSALRKTYAITLTATGFILNGVAYKRQSITPQQIPIDWPSPKFFLRKWPAANK